MYKTFSRFFYKNRFLMLIIFERFYFPVADFFYSIKPTKFLDKTTCK